MKIKINLFLLFFIVASCALFAKDKHARSYDSFYNQLAKSPYAAVLFYDKSKQVMKNDRLKEQIKELELMMRSLSKDPEYKDANLLFLRVDIDRDDLASIARQLRIHVFPTVQLFVGRTPVSGAIIQGSVTRAGINNLIDHYLRKQIDEYLKEKDEARKRALQRAQIRAYNRAYWGPYWYGGYGYPYWGGYYGPGYGFYYGW